MSLPKIPGAEIITVPPQPEKTFPDGFMRHMIINCPSPTSAWNAVISISPFNYDTGEMCDTTTSFKVQDLKLEATRSPIVAQVVGGVLTVVGLIVAEQMAITNQNNALRNLKIANDQLVAAQNLPDEDPDKANSIVSAQLSVDTANISLNNANTALETARIALGIT